MVSKRRYGGRKQSGAAAILMIGVGFEGRSRTARAEPLTRWKTAHYTGALTSSSAGALARRMRSEAARLTEGGAMRKFCRGASLVVAIAGAAVAAAVVQSVKAEGEADVQGRQRRVSVSRTTRSRLDYTSRTALDRADAPARSEPYFFLGNSYDNLYRPARRVTPPTTRC